MSYVKCPVCKQDTLTFEFVDALVDDGTVADWRCVLDGQSCECVLTEAQVEQLADDYVMYDMPYKGEYDPDDSDWWV